MKYSKNIKNIRYDRKETYIVHKRNPIKPVVRVDKASMFNELISMDMSEMKGKRFLVMINELIGYVQADWMYSKKDYENSRKNNGQMD